MLPIKFVIEIIVFGFLLIALVVYLVHQNYFSVKYSLIWLLVILSFLTSALIPNFIDGLRSFLGFEILSNMILSIMIGLLILLTLTLTIIVSGQKESIRLLNQELSLLKAKVNK